MTNFSPFLQNCQDFVQVCAWAKVEFPCFQNNSRFSFYATTSYLGICCSFNYRPDNGFEAYHSTTFGTKGGLSIVGSGYPQVADGKSGVLFSSGFLMLIHYPEDFPAEVHQMKLIKIGYITSVAIYPTFSHCSSDVLALPIESRQCVLPGEVKPDFRRQPSCAVACTRDYVYATCKCHPFHLPLPIGGPPMRECTAIDAACFSKHFCNGFGHFKKYTSLHKCFF